jgi:[1-hydroxy-2-(trimethylamino)ethyl]phosphonate dioxygenase
VAKSLFCHAFDMQQDHSVAMQTMMNTLLALYEQGGDRVYAGEQVTELMHAWQCGRLAEKSGAPAPLQLASWLHDVGHLWVNLAGTPTLLGQDDVHERIGADVLLPVFGLAVSEPVRLHVQAKRYLVSTRETYARKLSPDSLRSLHLQGGPMAPHECIAFEAEPFFADAVKLRVWDDLAKKSGWFEDTRHDALDHLMQLMRRVAQDQVT